MNEESFTSLLIVLIIVGAIALLIILIRVLSARKKESYTFPDPPDMTLPPDPGPVRRVPPKTPAEKPESGRLVISLDPGMERIGEGTVPAETDGTPDDVHREVHVLMSFPENRGMVKCPYCEAENTQGSGFCLSCGKSIR